MCGSWCFLHLLVHFWAAPGRMFSGMIALSWHSRSMAKAASKASPEDAQFFYKWNECSHLWMITRDSPRMPSPREEGSLTRERMKLHEKSDGGWVARYPLYPRDMLGESALCRGAATRDSLLLAPLPTCLLSRPWARCQQRWGYRLTAAFLGFHSPESPF